MLLLIVILNLAVLNTPRLACICFLTEITLLIINTLEEFRVLILAIMTLITKIA